MDNSFDLERLATMVGTQHGGRTLREVEADIGQVSPSTLSRVERGQLPDMDTFLLLCDWLKMPPALFFNRAGEATSDAKNDTADRGVLVFTKGLSFLRLRLWLAPLYTRSSCALDSRRHTP